MSELSRYGCFGRSELWPRGFPLSHLQWFVAEADAEPIAACKRTPVDHEVIVAILEDFRRPEGKAAVPSGRFHDVK